MLVVGWRPFHSSSFLFCTVSRTWHFHYFTCLKHWHRVSSAMPMNKSICWKETTRRIEYLFQTLAQTNTRTHIQTLIHTQHFEQWKGNGYNWHTCTCSRLYYSHDRNPAVFTVAVTQLSGIGFGMKKKNCFIYFSSIFRFFLAHECKCKCFIYRRSVSVDCGRFCMFSFLLCRSLYCLHHTQHRNRNQPKTFVTVSWLSTVAVPVRYITVLALHMFSIDTQHKNIVRSFVRSLFFFSVHFVREFIRKDFTTQSNSVRLSF